MTVELREVEESGAFTFRWPQLEEHFTRSWEGAMSAGERGGRFLHAVGEREVYGRRRPHTVTFIDMQPTVEGVPADDFERSQGLLSLIKPWKGHSLARELSDVPAAYQGLEIVDHRTEINAPYSKRCLAVKIRIDDLDSWARAAWARLVARGG